VSGIISSPQISNGTLSPLTTLLLPNEMHYVEEAKIEEVSVVNLPLS